MHQWFKSYAHFTAVVDFAYWWSFIGGGSAINGATPSSFSTKLGLIASKIHHLNIFSLASKTCPMLIKISRSEY